MRMKYKLLVSFFFFYFFAFLLLLLRLIFLFFFFFNLSCLFSMFRWHSIHLICSLCLVPRDTCISASCRRLIQQRRHRALRTQQQQSKHNAALTRTHTRIFDPRNMLFNKLFSPDDSFLRFAPFNSFCANCQRAHQCGISAHQNGRRRQSRRETQKRTRPKNNDNNNNKKKTRFLISQLFRL